MIQGIAGIRDNNFQMIKQMNQQLEEEETTDNGMRATYGQRWSRLPSSSLTAHFKQQLNDLQQKATVASQTDSKIEEQFSVHGDSLKLLNKTRNELAGLIP